MVFMSLIGHLIMLCKKKKTFINWASEPDFSIM